jgi:hypothetical protein
MIGMRNRKTDEQIITAVWGGHSDRTTLPDGCALRFPDSAPWRRTLRRFLEFAPDRYSSMTFRLEKQDGGLWLNVTGPEGTTDFIVGAHHILNSTLNPPRNLKRYAERGWQRATALWRTLPDFMVIGAMKSGTTSLFSYLIQHPAVAASAQKETDYFQFNYHRGTRYYRSYFPISALKKARGWSMTGEATPTYLYHPEVAGRVKSVLPEVRLVAILRNPVDRAYSHYHHRVRASLEPLGLAEALAEEPARLAQASDDSGSQASLVAALAACGYRSMGEYARYLRPWLAQFPREQLLVLTSESLAGRLEQSFSQLTRFLGLDDWSPPAYRRLNRAPYAPMEAAERAELLEYFRPLNAELEEMLGLELG